MARQQLVQKTFVHLGHQLGGPGQRQAEQGLARLHDLPGLDVAHQHAGIGRGYQRGLCQAGLGRHRGRPGQRQLRLRLDHVSAGIGVGLDLCLRAQLLRLGHIDGALRLIELRGAVEPLGHQLLHPRQTGAGRLQGGIGLCARCLCSAAAATAQAYQAGLRLALGRHGLRQRCRELVGLQLHQHVAPAHLRAFCHLHLGHAAGDGAAHIHPRQRGHARRKLQRAHQRRRLHQQGIDLRTTQRHHPGEGSHHQHDSAQRNSKPAPIHRSALVAMRCAFRHSENSPPAALGGATPRCRNAASVAMRPRGVRCKKPCWMR